MSATEATKHHGQSAGYLQLARQRAPLAQRERNLRLVVSCIPTVLLRNLRDYKNLSLVVAAPASFK